MYLLGSFLCKPENNLVRVAEDSRLGPAGHMVLVLFSSALLVMLSSSPPCSCGPLAEDFLLFLIPFILAVCDTHWSARVHIIGPQPAAEASKGI